MYIYKGREGVLTQSAGCWLNAHLIAGELGGILEIHVLGVAGAVAGGQSQTTEGIASGSVFHSAVHDLLSQGVGHRGLQWVALVTSPKDHFIGLKQIKRQTFLTGSNGIKF